MRLTAYYRVQSPEALAADVAQRATISKELRAVRRWAQGLEELLRDGDRQAAQRQTEMIVRGLRTIERQVR